MTKKQPAGAPPRRRPPPPPKSGAQPSSPEHSHSANHTIPIRTEDILETIG